MRLLGMLGAATLVVATACGGGGDDGGPGPTPQQTLDRINPSVTTLALSAGSSSAITVTALDTQGGTISNPGTFTFSSRSAAVADVTSQGTVFAIGAGSTTIDISLTRGGVTKQATVGVTVTGTLGLSATVAAGTTSNTFQPQVVVIARTGTVMWSFGSLEHNVTFAGVTGAPANIGNTTNASVSRTFNTAGNVAYDCTLHAGMTGTVVVR
jgi:plastocyanin